ncbi:MAG: ABC transporter permease [Clostridia bacterium]
MVKDKIKIKLKALIKSPNFNSISASVASIIIGLVFGLLLLMIININFSMSGFLKILVGGFSSLSSIGEVLYMAVPILMTGLSVGFAFKTGLFNIGASGQFFLGGFFALYAAIIWQFPWYLSLLCAMVGGALIGSLPGIFKAFFNVNEVITSIMLNWISLFAVNLMCRNTPSMLGNPSDKVLSLETLGNPSIMIPDWGLKEIFNTSFMNISIFITIAIAIVIYLILNKTTFGYELKACGLNKNAAKYAGISAKRNIILSMVIAGALAGIGGGLRYLAGPVQLAVTNDLVAEGFNGIPVALLAYSNPIGIIFSALFLSYITVGGDALQPEFSREIITIIISVIIYLSAFSLLFRDVIARLFAIKGKKALKAADVANAVDDSLTGGGTVKPNINKPIEAMNEGVKQDINVVDRQGSVKKEGKKQDIKEKKSSKFKNLINNIKKKFSKNKSKDTTKNTEEDKK